MSAPFENGERRVGSKPRRFFSPEARFQRPGLTGLRALAAFWVLAFHLNGYAMHERLVVGFEGFHVDLTPLVTIGWVGVDVFFVLSGFLLTIHVLERLGEGAVVAIYPSYLRDRILRVVPAYWTQIAILFVLAWAARGSMPHWASSVPMHLVFLQNFSLSGHGAINGAYWTLPVEFSFYLLVPFIAAWAARAGNDAAGAGRRAVFVAALAVAISFGWRAFAVANFGHAGVPTLFWASAMHLPGSADQFGIGVAAALLFLAWGAPDGTRDRQWSRASDALVVAGLGGLVAAMYTLDAFVGHFWTHSILFYGWHCLAALAVALLVTGVAARGPLARAVFENRLVVWLGVISYSLYLWHPIVAEKLAAVVGAESQGLRAFAMVAVPVIVAASAASYYLVERPFLRRKRSARPAERTLQ